MLYLFQRGDTLSNIAIKFGTTIPSILVINVICKPNLIFIGQPLIIPQPGLDFPKAGGSPYYVIQPGDTLWCLGNQFSQSAASLAASNLNPTLNLVIQRLPKVRQSSSFAERFQVQRLRKGQGEISRFLTMFKYLRQVRLDIFHGLGLMPYK